VFWTAGRINCPVEEINVWVHVMVYYFIGSEIATQLCKQRFYLRGYCTVSFKWNKFRLEMGRLSLSVLFNMDIG